MARGKVYNDETKAAVLAALLAGQSVSSLAVEHRINRTTIQRWRSAAGLDAPLMHQQKREEVGRHLVSLLIESLTTLESLQRQFRDKTWTAKQSAAELAILYGVSFDKAAYLAAALQQPDEQSAGTGNGADVAG